MPVAPKFAPPQPSRAPLTLPALESAAAGGVTLFNAPPGYLPESTLAALLEARGGLRIWVRLGPEDRDPATLAASLIAALQLHDPRSGERTRDQMRRRPGPLLGWPPIFAELAQELGAALGPRGSLVLAGCHHLGDVYQTMQLLSAHILAPLSPDVSCVLTAERTLPQAILPAGTDVHSQEALRLGERAAEELGATLGCELAGATIRRAAALLDGRGATLLDLCAAAATLGPVPVRQAVERSRDLTGLLARVARAWLVMADAADQRALGLAMRLGQLHPDLLAAAGASGRPAGPWFQRLAGGWLRLQPVWQAPLGRALGAHAAPERGALIRAAAHLLEAGSVEQAISLYLELGERGRAAEAIAQALEPLVSLGHWETLEEWMCQLPAQTLSDWPWLVYVSGELAAAQGQLAAAQRAFSLASQLFEARRDMAGWCQSLLAESTLAAWCGNRARAESCARGAAAQARAAGLLWQSGWALWQLGCLAAADADLDRALAHFGEAQAVAAQLGDELMLALPRQAELLVLRQRDLRRASEHHRAAYWAAAEAEQTAAEQLRLLVASPLRNLDALLESHGWAQLPLMLKLLAPPSEGAPLVAAERGGLWGRLLGLIGLGRATASPAPPAQLDISLLDLPPPRRALHGELIEAPLALELGAAHSSMTAQIVAAPAERARQAGGPDLAAPEPAEASLAAYLLGPFRVTLNGRGVESWPSGRGRAVLKYLLAQRDRPVPRDVLMDFFWPDSTPEAARNSLNVAIHGLRQAFRAVAEKPVVVFEGGAYRLNPALALWVDVEEFERHIQAARRLEEGGQLGAAMAAYEAAIGLYGGDFLLDDPYEEWPVLTRERLRVMQIEALDRLGQIHFAQGQYAACAARCQQLLAADSCHEEAHCRLMRCHARIGQHPAALRQYQACAEALRAELDVAPSPATVELYERIRRREPV